MPWQNTLSNDAGKSFAADEQNEAGASASPAIGGEICPACPEELVLVEFAEKPGSNAAFGGLRAQYVNFSSDKLVGVDPEVKSAHQLGRTPPIVVKVSPPKSKTVTLRLIREDRSHGFPAGSETLSTREKGLSHLTWPVSTATVTTNAKGEGKLDPGMTIPALGGYKFKVEGRIDKKPFVRSGNSVNVRRRLAIRPVVRYVNGQPTAMAAINAIKSDLEALDIEVVTTDSATGGELGVRELPEINPTLEQIATTALNSPDAIKAFRPHAVAVIVGEFIPSANGALTPETFDRTITRDPASGNFPASAVVPMSKGGITFTIVPLTNGSQFVAGRVTVGAPGSAQTLNPPEVTGTTGYSQSVTVNLSRFQAVAPSVTTLTISVTMKAISGYHVGWAYPSNPVIYLNMMSPFTRALLTSTKAAALMIHELGHKLHLASPGGGTLPDKQAHHYPTMTTAPNHQGPHCSTGVPDGADLTLRTSHDAATCTMWGALKETRQFCPECQTSLRKVDLSGGF